jgi:hypothetical protein
MSLNRLWSRLERLATRRREKQAMPEMLPVGILDGCSPEEAEFGELVRQELRRQGFAPGERVPMLRVRQCILMSPFLSEKAHLLYERQYGYGKEPIAYGLKELNPADSTNGGDGTETAT